MPRRPGSPATAPPTLPTLHLSRDHDRSVVAANIRSSTWTRVRRGAAIDASLLVGPDRARVLALARLAAARDLLTADHVVSHDSAALLWGLPTLTVPSRTHVITPHTGRVGASADLVRHVHRLTPEDTTTLHGLRVTTLERTVVDCAMSSTVRAGLVVADAALQRGADPGALRALVTRMAGRRGVVRARVVLEYADDGSESAGESLARAALLAAGAPVPVTQVPVTTRLGTYWGDLGWPAFRLLGEYDGHVKYAGTPADAVVREKRREDALLDAGWRVLRLTRSDLDVDHVARRIRPLFAGDPLTPRAELLW